MNILIICTWFRPDTAIAAKRPYMFAKILSERGHNVTVIRSGLIHKVIDESFDESNFNFKIVSYFDSNSVRIAKVSAANNAKQILSFLPFPFYNLLKKILNILSEPLIVYRAKRMQSLHFEKIKETIDKLESHNFDIVFSTYGEMANIDAGRYARNIFHCKWVLDFRDRIVQPHNKSWLWNVVFSKFECKAINDADKVTAVSDDLFTAANYPSDKLVTLYNGYCSEDNIIVSSNTEFLSFSYAGSVYGLRGKALIALFEVLNSLLNDNKIELSRIKLNIAGSNGDEIVRIASKYGLESIVVNHGYLQPKQIQHLLAESDVFLVLSENTKFYQGILTGKFYEGVQFKKPILSIISGNTPNSELFRLNDVYHYGFCYETCRSKEMKNKFRSFIMSLYISKIETGIVDFNLNDELVEKFDYRNLTKELESLFIDLVKN